MTQPITTAEAANRILDKFRSCEIRFEAFGHSHIDFRRGDHDRFRVFTGIENFIVWERCNGLNDFTAYSKWIEGVLNGLVRNDEGELVEKTP